MNFTTQYTEYAILYKHSKQPYSPPKSWTTSKKFAPSYDRKNNTEFVLEELKQLVRPDGIEPPLRTS